MLIRDIKLSLGAMAGILIAHFFGLSNPLTAGIIVLLSLGKTKRSSVDIAVVRVKSVALALVLASGVFLLFGFTVYAFSGFLFLFIPLILKLKLENGLIIGSVLSTHLISASAIDFGILFNTIALFVIGVSVAILFNLYMPDMSEKVVENQRYIEDRFREILLIIATVIRGDHNFDQSIFTEVKQFIDDALMRAKTNDDNHLFADVSYYAKYIGMRKMQFDILNRMFELVCKIDMDLVQADLMAELTEDFAHSLSESGTGEEMLKRLEVISAECKDGPLPKSRREFENRAILFQYLSELRHMVELKREFRSEYGKKV